MKKLILLLLFIPLVFSCSNNSTKYSGDFEYPISDYWIFNEDGGNSENPTSMLALKFNYFKKNPEMHYVFFGDYNYEKEKYDIEWKADILMNKLKDSLFIKYSYISGVGRIKRRDGSGYNEYNKYRTAEYNYSFDFIAKDTIILKEKDDLIYLTRYPLYNEVEARELVKEKQSDYELGLISDSDLNAFKERIKRYF